MNKDCEQMISIEQFVYNLMKDYKAKSAETDFVLYGYQNGWLEDQDVSGKSNPLNRKSAARILHQFLRLELAELDESDGSAASVLQDLYECRVCAGHIIQVYVKGIMGSYTDEDGRKFFGLEMQVSEEEAEEIITRLFNVQKRTPRVVPVGESRNVEVISATEALRILETEKSTVLVDVRTQKAFEENHIKGAVNIPLMTVLKNPYAVSERRDLKVLLYCEDGYQSAIAANCLADAGYGKLYSFAWKA